METNNNVSPEAHLKTIMENAFSLIEKMKTGKGLGLTPEQEDQYKKAFSESGAQDQLNDFNKKMEEMRSKMPGMNNPKP